ncbi:MAG: hypothetical protein GY941_04125 [Planctomycetes bacterium]|nr:hypothetical protein [Planctomycetota bacterium]
MALYKLNNLIDIIEARIDRNTALYKLNALIDIIEERIDYIQEFDQWYREYSPSRSNEDVSVEDEGYYNRMCMFRFVEVLNGVEVERKVREGTPSSIGDSSVDGFESSHRTHLSCSSFSSFHHRSSYSPPSSRTPFIFGECPSVD